MNRKRSKLRGAASANKTSNSSEDHNLILGINALMEVLKSSPARVNRVVLSDKWQTADKRRQAVAARLKDLGIRFEFRPDHYLNDISRSDSHQGIVAYVEPRQLLDLKSFLNTENAKERSILFILDSINDPHNLGAILRAAECFGIDGVIISKNRGAPITAVVSKSSAGASELVDIVSVANLAEAVRKLKESGYWIIAADSEKGDGSVTLPKLRPDRRLAVILGSEGRGVQPLLLKLADYRVNIPQFGRIDSLNVSQAAAVFGYQIRLAFGDA